MHKRRLLLALPLALLASCDSSSPTTVTGLNGAITFTYSGGISGSFSATGAVPTNPTEQETTSWAAAEAASATEIVLAGSAPRTTTSHDVVVVYIQRTTVGTETISPSCSTTCNDVAVIFGMTNSTGASFLQSCFLTSGSIAITEKSASRVKGTFSGTGDCMPPAGTPTTTFTVTNGVFDLPIVTSVP